MSGNKEIVFRNKTQMKEIGEFMKKKLNEFCRGKIEYTLKISQQEINEPESY